MPRIPCLLLLTSLAGGCSTTSGTRPPAKSASEKRAPRLVVLVVLDQLGKAVLDRHISWLDPDGALRSGIARGVRHDVRYDYATLVTAAGHAAISTGTAPWESGIQNNRRWDYLQKSRVSLTWDEDHPVLGAPGMFASPRALLTAPVGSWLKRDSKGRGKVVSLSYKDRGALFLGGADADIAVWFDKLSSQYTTSTYYAKALPKWLQEFNAAHPVTDYLQEWTPIDPERYAERLGPDAGPGESNWHGFGTSFPHDPRKTSVPIATFGATPASTRHLLALADTAVAALQLGEDDAPDLLTISISGTDLVGHIFGTQSWEYVDNLRRVDSMLGKFLDRLGQRAPTAVVITSDHGSMPVPESLVDATPPAGRLAHEELLLSVESGLSQAFGKGPWVENYVEPFIFLTQRARLNPQVEKIRASALALVVAHPAIHSAYDVRKGAELRTSEDELTRLVGNSLPENAFGDLYVVPKENITVDPRLGDRADVTHGTPWLYDREVPVIMFGAGIKATQATGVLEQRRVAKTVGALLGIRGPKRLSDAEPLPGVPSS